MRAPSSADDVGRLAVDDGADETAVLGQVEADETAVGERAAKHALDRGLDVAEHLELAIEELREEDRELVVGGSSRPRAGGRGARPARPRSTSARCAACGPRSGPGTGRRRRSRTRPASEVRKRSSTTIPSSTSAPASCASSTFGTTPIADDREEALDRPAVRRPRTGQQASVARQLLELGLEQDLDALAPVQLDAAPPTAPGARSCGMRVSPHLDDRHLEAARPQ